jgi:hypothetical protein
MFQKLDEGLLDDVLGVLMMTQQDEGKPIDRRAVLVEEPKRSLPPVVR